MSAQLAGNKYVINVKQIAKFVVGLGEKVAPTDIEEGMRVGVDRAKYSIQIPLPPKIDPTVSLMTVEDKPDVTYEDVGGAKEAMEKLREVLETPLLHPERFVALGIEPPKGVLLYGPPGTGELLWRPFFQLQLCLSLVGSLSTQHISTGFHVSFIITSDFTTILIIHTSPFCTTLKKQEKHLQPVP